MESFFACVYFGFPARKLTIIGVTGTDGKTTTTTLIAHILKTAGYKTASQTTLSATHTTTPTGFHNQKFLSQCITSCVTHVVLEVSSHGVDQNRIWGIPFKVGVLTNITNNEHLDYHRTFENYKKAKLRFLNSCEKVIVNMDDSSYGDVFKSIPQSKIVTYAIKAKADYQPKVIDYKSTSTEIGLPNLALKTKLLGEFNVYNTLAALGAAKLLGVSDDVIIKALATFSPPPGRLEIVVSQPFTVIVDFAHTAEAFEKVLPIAAGFKKTKANKLIHVFGATGMRDRGKRPILAQNACKYDDVIILTHEDTYTEDLKSIINQVESGIDKQHYNYIYNHSEVREKANSKKGYYKIEDRGQAIKKALDLAQSGDVVILTGVGHQTSMNIGGKEVPWSDKEEVLKFLDKDHGK